MAEKQLTAWRLAGENLRRQPLRVVCLTAVAAILASALFGGAIFTTGIQTGLDVLAARFGADLMVVPTGNAQKAEAVLLGGEPNYFYFNGEIARKIAPTPGVRQVSPQFFLTSLSADCCDLPVQLIAFEPETDFVVKPWLTALPAQGLRDGQIAIGCDILARENRTVKLFGREYPVAAQIGKTATGLDRSVLMNMSTIRTLIDHAHQEKLHFLADDEPAGAISAVLVRLDGTRPPATVAREIRRENPNVEVVVAQGVVQQIGQALRRLKGQVFAVLVALWVVAATVLTAVYSGSVNERKKEFSVLRLLGATRAKVAGIVLGEAFLTASSGGLIGVVLAALAVFPFSTYIGDRLQLPYIPPAAAYIFGMALFSLALVALAGLLAAAYAAWKIGRAETYLTMRAGE
ncbi:ABC transporter permease [Planctomycetales bacterium]|nr:ABC transporter permease [Planctomycetales bacterium]